MPRCESSVRIVYTQTFTIVLNITTKATIAVTAGAPRTESFKQISAQSVGSKISWKLRLIVGPRGDKDCA